MEQRQFAIGGQHRKIANSAFGVGCDIAQDFVDEIMLLLWEQAKEGPAPGSIRYHRLQHVGFAFGAMYIAGAFDEY